VALVGRCCVGVMRPRLKQSTKVPLINDGLAVNDGACLYGCRLRHSVYDVPVSINEGDAATRVENQSTAEVRRKDSLLRLR
jgi:hypothetical protein